MIYASVAHIQVSFAERGEERPASTEFSQPNLTSDGTHRQNVNIKQQRLLKTTFSPCTFNLTTRKSMTN